MLFLSCVTDEISDDITSALKSGIEYEVFNYEIRAVNDRRFPLLYNDDIDTIKQFIDEGKIKVSAVSPGIFKSDHFNKLSDQDKDVYIKRVFDLAKDFGTNRVIVFAGNQFDETKESIKMFCSESKKKGFFVYLENSAGTCIKSASDIIKMIDASGADNLMANWDPGNSQVCGCLDIYEDHNMLKAYIGNIHIKDVGYDKDKNPVFVPVGKGVVDYQSLIGMLLNDGYDSYITIETHCKPSHPAFIESLEYIKDLIKEV